MELGKKIYRTLSAAALGIAVTLCLTQGVLAQGDPIPPYEYVITGSDDQFTAVRFGMFTVAANQPMQLVIDAVKADAAGNPCTITFGGDEAETIDIDYDYISFDNGQGETNWGIITIKGKISSKSTTVINLYENVSVNSRAEITNAANSGGSTPQNYGILHGSTGTLTISGGTVSSPFGIAVVNYGSGPINIYNAAILTESGIAISNKSAAQIIISGATVSATTGRAIQNDSTGVIIIMGNALVTSANIGLNTGTISISGGTATVIHSGSTVENTANSANSRAIHTSSTGAVNIGGKVLARQGYAVYKTGTGAVNLTDNGVAFAYGTGVSDVIYGTYVQTQNEFSMIIAWNQAAGNTGYTRWSNNDLFMETLNINSPLPVPLPTVMWNEPNRIAYSYNSNTGFIEIEGVTVESGSAVQPSVRAGSTNPAQFVKVFGNTLQLRFPERGSLAVYALNGARVRAFDLDQGAQTLRLNDLPRGTYMIRSISGAWKQSVRMVVR